MLSVPIYIQSLFFSETNSLFLSEKKSDDMKQVSLSMSSMIIIKEKNASYVVFGVEGILEDSGRVDIEKEMVSS